MSAPRSIAIVGVAGRFPDAPDVPTLWANVITNRVAARAVTDAEWPVPPGDVVNSDGAAKSDQAASSKACLLGDFDLDVTDLDLPTGGVGRLSRLARLTLRVGKDAWRSVTSKVDPTRASVILANIALPTDGASKLAEDLFLGAADEAILGTRIAGPLEPLDAFPSALPAGILARALGLGGGSFTLDAACASSLYAIHLACRDLEAGRVDAVLCGGVSLPQSLYTQVGFTQLLALSRSGSCLPYDEDADGLIVGEGAAMVVLKREEDALRDGDTVLAIIRGIGLSNDVGGSLLSPDSEGQLRAMRAAYAEAGWLPDDVDLVEGHGTGTPRGDAVELASLAALWEGREPRGSVLGSVKGNIGHLLTAAGAAGLCKVLTAIGEETLPPSVQRSNGSRALHAGPFRTLSSPLPWTPRRPGAPRRAAVSAFGFGGINAHLLIEEVGTTPVEPTRAVELTRARGLTPAPIAIVGMAAHVGRLDSLGKLERAVLLGETVDDPVPAERWHGLESTDASPRLKELRRLRGAFIASIQLPAGRFKLPPNDVASVLPQQLLALKIAGEAFGDAKLLGKGPHLRVGAVVGIALDLSTTSFHLRWLVRERARRWAEGRGLALTPSELDAWTREVLLSLGPALDSTRTLGALGGIVPSRVAREFQLGGPSFAVADDEASGLRALEVAVRLLQQREVDAMLACAVDLAGDVRSVLASDQLRAFSPSNHARPFDQRADGAKVAEGAAAVVLKRLDDALAAGDRVYAVVRGIGAAGGGALEPSAPAREHAYVRAATAAYRESGVSPSRVGLVETHGSGSLVEDATEARALGAIFQGSSDRPGSIALAAASPTVGQAGAAGGLVSLVKAALSLHHEVLPPIGDVASPSSAIDWAKTPFHLPRVAQAWLRDRADGPRVAGVSSMALGGTCMHVVLESSESSARPPPLLRTDALFLLRGEGGGAVEGSALRTLAAETPALEALANRWHHQTRSNQEPVTRAIAATSTEDLLAQLARAVPSAKPIGGKVAVVFPGSGNHFIGMGRGLALAFPEAYRRLDDEVLHLAGHLQPACIAPRRTSWGEHWEDAAQQELTSVPERVIVAQVAHGLAVYEALRLVGVRADAFLGYSLGESAALFASRAWRDRDTMFDRTRRSALFRSELAGEMSVLRRAWGADADWRVVIVTRPAAEVRAALRGTAALLIVNAPRECVVGGTTKDVDATVASLGCDAIPLESVPTVHLPLVEAVRDAYRDHHFLPTTPPADVTFYGTASAAPYTPTDAAAAESVTASALRGFDFPALIQRAWADGIRVFVEAGPQGSCTRMIARILEGKAHSAVSACHRERDGYRAFLGALARLAEAGVRLDLDALYGAANQSVSATFHAATLPSVVLGGLLPPIPLRPRVRPEGSPNASRLVAPPASPVRSEPASAQLASFFAGQQATSDAHEAFLRTAQDGLVLQAQLYAQLAAMRSELPDDGVATPSALFDRAACIELAIGKLSRVLGDAFADVDAFPTRVRLPDEPLMLVDRIILVEGEMGVIGPGRVVTEHDVLENAWYLEGDRAPVCISVEAGQADLFLSGYLGIDRETRGERVYRLLDAKIVFHRDLPRPGERIRYDIRIDRFIHQGDTWLFFFRFDGTIDGQDFISMYEGCAGFFSPEQLDTGRGIVARAARAAKAHVANAVAFSPLVPDAPRFALTDAKVEALRRGDLQSAFGVAFAGKTLATSLRLPGGRMKLVDRIVSLDAHGGPAGLGEVVGEADIFPDAWYLTCHFIDDQVMPGTLMYECCLHTLRVLLLRLGWIVTDDVADMHFGPILGVASELRCRGQVTRQTKKVRYRVSIDQIGYGPEPFVIATASMFADDKHVVQMDGMSVRLHGTSKAALERTWGATPLPAFDRAKVVAYAEGNPSECFGDRYRAFDHDRRLARLPRDPYLFLDRVTSVDAEPWVLAPGGWVTCEYDVAPDAWYFAAGGQGTMPFAVLLEVALQPCGWLAAYLGSALLSDVDLHFRNLDGHGVQHREVGPGSGTITARARLRKTSQAGGMILQEFDLEVLGADGPIYVGRTGFGFFPAAALAAQVGLRGATSWGGAGDQPRARAVEQRGGPVPVSDVQVSATGLGLPKRTLLMVDEVSTLDLTGGPKGLGFVVGEKVVDPDEWFFRAHFYQDPVMPGSLGLEALVSLMKIFAAEKFPELATTHRFEAMARGREHRWQYRGQVTPTNQRVRVEARIASIMPGDEPVIVAEGQLSVDGRLIYAMTDFAVRLVRIADRGGAS